MPDANSLATLGNTLLGDGLLLALTLVGLYLIVRREIRRLQETIDQHEERNKERWEHNWADHRDFNTRISRLEGGSKEQP